MSVKSVLFYVYFYFLWIIPMINKYSGISEFLYVILFTLGCIVLIFIENYIVSAILSVILVVVTVFSDLEILLLIFPLYPLIFAYIELNKFIKKNAIFIGNKKANKQKAQRRKSSFLPVIPLGYMGAILSVVFCVVCLAYRFFELNEHVSLSGTFDYHTSYYGVFALFGAFAVYIFSILKYRVEIDRYASEKNYQKNVLKLLNLMHIVAFFGFVVHAGYYFVLKQWLFNGYERVVFLPWVIYIAATVYYKDPVIVVFFEKIKNFSFSEKMI